MIFPVFVLVEFDLSFLTLQFLFQLHVVEFELQRRRRRLLAFRASRRRRSFGGRRRRRRSLHRIAGLVVGFLIAVVDLAGGIHNPVRVGRRIVLLFASWSRMDLAKIKIVSQLFVIL